MMDSPPKSNTVLNPFFKKKKSLCIWLHQVLVVAHGIFDLSCSMWDLVPQLGIETEASALGVQSLSHWTKVPV